MEKGRKCAATVKVPVGILEQTLSKGVMVVAFGKDKRK